ncbi:hypothetical protein ACGF4C_37720 [Streptomyces sp. NPDC048197]|uniref:hypothetical protein n=1 Tax=Streptomyces sp. NPDC048197 TaxID=3365511 RepID=UPI0037185B8C
MAYAYLSGAPDQIGHSGEEMELAAESATPRHAVLAGLPAWRNSDCLPVIHQG